MKYSPTEVARQFLFVRESSTQNTGNRVEAIQKWCGGLKGESYCAYFDTMVLDICFQGNSPIPRLGSCQAIYGLAKEKGWLTDKPVKDDLFLYVDDNDHAHHTGIGTVDGGKTGIAGNTSEDGTSSNGTGIFEHDLTINPKRIKWVHYPR